MSESEPNVELLLQRIDELLDVLNIISRDLVDVSKALKAIGPSTSAPTERVQRMEHVRTLFPKDLEEMLEFEETENHIVIRPRGYLGSDNFAKIASIIRDAGGEYISAGKESHFRLSREGSVS